MPSFGLIGGSGLDSWRDLESSDPAITPYGEASAAPALLDFQRSTVYFLPRHGPGHSIAPHKVNYRANLWALHEAGVEQVIAVNAVGSLDLGLPPGTLVVPDQLIDYTWGREHTFLDGEDHTLEHIEFENPFSEKTQKQLVNAAAIAGVKTVEGGCVGVTQGPRLETRAEITRLGRDGCDLVGMTSMPEAALARELGVYYGAIAVVANYAAGITEEPITMDAIDANLGRAMSDVRRLLQYLFEEI